MSYLSFPGFISNELCSFLIDYYEDNYDIVLQNPEEVPQADSFRYKVMWYNSIESQELRKILDYVSNRTYDKIKEYYNVNVERDALQIVRWKPGDKMELHADNAFYPTGEPNNTSFRTHSSIIFLNDDFGGGQFYFKKFGNVIPKPGTLIIFPSDIKYAHGVRKVYKHNRYTIASWYTDQEKYWIKKT